MTNTTTTLSGFFKEVYADKLADLRPQAVTFYNDTPFVPKNRQTGNTYNQPVALADEQGFTYALQDAGAFSINTSVAAQHKNARVNGAQLLLETRLDYESAARGSSSQKAFGAVTKYIMQNMIKSFHKREEVRHIYGGATLYSGICRLGARTVDAGTTQTYAVRDQDWAPGIMAGLEGAKLDGYNDNGAGGIPSTKLNATSAITVESVNFSDHEITLTGVEAELDLLNTPATTAVFLYYQGSFGNEPQGAVRIASNEGTLFEINAALFGLWEGNTYPVGNTDLLFDKILKGFDGPVEKGLMEGATLLMNPKTWTNAMTDLAALRKYDGSYSKKKLTNGSEGIEFAGQFGGLIIKPSLFIKEGIALGYPTGEFERIGATDMTFKVPGMEKEDFMYQLPSNAGYGVRAYSNEAPFIPTPGKCVLFTGIINSA